MGQYFAVANLDKKETLSQFSFQNSGLKLTETCYVGNGFVNALTYLLANDWHGDRVLFCGDYAWACMGDEPWATRLRGLASDDPYLLSGSFRDRSGDFAAAQGAMKLADTEDGRFAFVPLEGTFHIQTPTLRYVVNETLGVYYDREEAPVAWVEWKTDRALIARTDPLTLFMAIGNGGAGGDYHGPDAPNFHLVGSWAGHAIGAASERPEGLERIACPFDETGCFLTASEATIEAALRRSLPDRAYITPEDLAPAVAHLKESNRSQKARSMLDELCDMKRLESSASAKMNMLDQDLTR